MAETRNRIVEGTTYTRRRHPLTGQVVPWSATQIGMMKGMDGHSLKQAEEAAALAHGNPGISSDLKLVGSTSRMFADGFAMVRLDWGRTDIVNFGGGADPPIVRWSTGFLHRVRRYFKIPNPTTAPVTLAANGELVQTLGPRFAAIDIDVPAARLYKLQESNEFPGNIMDGVGSFFNLTGVGHPVMKLAPDVKEKGAGDSYKYEIVYIFEWRHPNYIVRLPSGTTTQAVNGWADHEVSPNGSIYEIKPQGAP